MPASGPSKDELNNYWNNNRQYFDELARYYLESDREYYDKFIAPFYSNPFRSAASPSGGSGQAKLALIIIAMVCVLGAGAVAFFVMMQSQPVKTDNRKTIMPPVAADSVRIPNIPKIIDADSTKKVIKTKSPNYEKGMKYYHAKNFKAAEECFNSIDENDVNYQNAQKRLMEVKFLIYAEETEQEQKNKDRKHPIERIH